MSVEVPVAELLAAIDGYASVPLALTVDDDGRPRAAAVTVTGLPEPTPAPGGPTSVASGADSPPPNDPAAVTLQIKAGSRTAANAARRPLVSLLWPAAPGERFALLVDGVVEGVHFDEPAADPSRMRKPGGIIALRVEHAMLHVMKGR